MNTSLLPCILSVWYNSLLTSLYALYWVLSAQKWAIFLRPAGGHIGNLRSGPILAVLIHSFSARQNRLFTKRSKNWAWSQVNTEGAKRVTQFFYDVIAVWAKWGPVSWMAGKAGLLWSTVFFWQIYKTYSIGNRERSFPQREAYSF